MRAKKKNTCSYMCVAHMCPCKMRSARGRLVQFVRFVLSYNYLQVTYLKGHHASVRGIVTSRANVNTRNTLPSPAFMNFRTVGCGFAFNCERDSSLSRRSALHLALFKTRKHSKCPWLMTKLAILTIIIFNVRSVFNIKTCSLRILIDAK